VPALELILRALMEQSYIHFEIIIAEDDVKSDFYWLKDLGLNQKLKHVYQDVKDGFRKNQVLNKAVQVSEGDYLIFVDGDCIPHQHFVKSYARFLAQDRICYGRRVMVSPEITEALYKSMDLKRLNLIRLMLSSSKRLKYMMYVPWIIQKRNSGIWGHNWGVARQSLIDINGFDEDYITAGVGEDIDIEWRLLSKGLSLYSIRFAAIQFHLHHKENYDAKAIRTGREILAKKVKDGHIICRNGLIKY
jgi:cellulose synthase/poly-beta-1,6-N-acetylglucosamine synthase-like glycosyltransferase